MLLGVCSEPHMSDMAAIAIGFKSLVVKFDVIIQVVGRKKTAV